jgi:hypothetical protein
MGACGCFNVWNYHYMYGHTHSIKIYFSGGEYFQGNEDPIFTETVSTEYDPDSQQR